MPALPWLPSSSGLNSSQSRVTRARIRRRTATGARTGKYKAVVAIAHSVLVIIYHLLRGKRPYADLGPDYFDQLDATRLQRHHVRRLEQLGYTVTLHPQEAA